jgi:hypothetical protein
LGGRLVVSASREQLRNPLQWNEPLRVRLVAVRVLPLPDVTPPVPPQDHGTTAAPAETPATAISKDVRHGTPIRLA